jgi:plastocyanin
VPYLRFVGTLMMAAISAALVQASGPAPAAGRIEGTVRLVAPAGVAIASGAYPSRRVSKRAAPVSQMKNVVVFVKDAPAPDRLAPIHAEIVQKDEAFDPAVLPITRGSTVEFPNSDPYFHNVFSLSRVATFDLGRYPRGATRARTFNRAGLVKVYCHLHSHMSASILVFDHDLFTVPSPDGTFRIDDVPAGRYTLTAWHERIGESARRIDVAPGRIARAEFLLPVEDR